MNPVYRFAECELDPHERRLLVHGQAVTLTPKVFDTLVLLVERAGHVVSKDELLATLWPRGFVHESNLTKHIWLIRRALSDEGGESRCIETVPKLGYRFIAPVCCTADETVTTATSAVQPADVGADATPVPVEPDGRTNDTATPAPATNSFVVHKRRVGLAVIIIAMAFVLVVAAMLHWRTVQTPVADMTGTPGSAVAIIDFNNLSNNAKDAWMAPALTEMLAIEITAGGRLHAIPDELVRVAHADLPAPMAGGYAPASLSRLHQRLGSDYVLSGSYLVFGDTEAPQLRLDLAVQDARNGMMVADLSRSGAVSELPALVVAAGAGLREKLGIGPLSGDTLRLAANAQPPTTEVARHIGFALDALQKYDPSRARDELLQAIAQAPGYAPAYAYLAQAWAALGYRAKALAASKQALANATGLPDEQRLQIEAQQYNMQADQPRTIDTWRKLVALRPQNPDYPLQLVAALVAAGRNDEADTVLTALRRMPGAVDDPRIELAALNIATARDDAKAVMAHAQRALQLAQTRAEPGLIASAQLQLGVASGNTADAESMLHSAAVSFRKIGNPHGEAQSYQNLANLLFTRNQIPAARESYERAMAIYQGIGDLGGVAAIYDDLSRMLWAAGDRDGAEAALRQAMQIGRETSDLERQAWSLTGLATVMSDESASDEVAHMYQQALALDEQAGIRAHHVFALAAYSDLLRQRGELDLARNVCTKGQAEASALGDAEQITNINFECAQIALDRGDVDAASAVFKSIAQQAKTAGDTFNLANAKLLLGQVAMGRLRWVEATDALQISLDNWTTSQETAGEAVGEGLLALCYSASGDKTARDKAATHARDLRARVNQRQEILTLDIALMQLQGDIDIHGNGVAALQALADDAAKRGWLGMALEARLAMVQVLEHGSDFVAAKRAHDELAKDAGQHGYGWIVQRLAMTPAHPQPP
jgi:DNA-binding winged helix-turn-helix (wHTH) protein/tetratricopeptide (TPR) repeat protein